MAALTLVKKGKNVALWKDKDGTEYIQALMVRLSFPKIGHPEPETDDDGTPRIDPKTRKQKSSFSGVFMAPKETHDDVKKFCVEVINKLMKENDVKIATDKKFIKDGDGETREEYEGHWIINARESKRPPARNARAELVLDPDEIEDMFPAGVHVNVLLRPWYYSGTSRNSTKTFPKRISCGLAGIQFAGDDGTRYGGGQVDESDVWDVAEGAEASGGNGMNDEDEL